MYHRPLLLGGVAALVCLTSSPAPAEATWEGPETFAANRASWEFDGLYGPRTIAAVSAYQQAHRFRVDGVAGAQTQRALGLKPGRVMKAGLGGPDVLALQKALAAEGFWYGHHGRPVAKAPKPRVFPTPRATPRPKATPKPPSTPRPTPTPNWEEPPVMQTPEPEPTHEPTPEPVYEVDPTPMPTPTPAPARGIRGANQPMLALEAGTWFLPGPAGGTAYDFSFTRPTWTGDATLWLGDVGVGGALTIFNATYATFRTAPYFQPNTYMYDALLKYRLGQGHYHLFGGYRGLGAGDLNFGTAGLGLERPLVGDWLWLEGRAQGGHNFTTSYFLDGQAGLELRFSPLAIELGFRHLLLQAGTDPQFNTNGPTAALKLRF